MTVLQIVLTFGRSGIKERVEDEEEEEFIIYQSARIDPQYLIMFLRIRNIYQLSRIYE